MGWEQFKRWGEESKSPPINIITLPNNLHIQTLTKQIKNSSINLHTWV